MIYTKLGNTGLDVSKICLGCMSFGDPVRWPTHSWVKNEDESREIIKKAIDLGINFFDTANVYSAGASEEYLGRALKDFANRSEVVVATKVYFKMHEGQNNQGLSRKHIMEQIDQSLKRLDMDYIDLYIIHRWDYNTPIEETMEALHDIVKAGKVRYIGASAMYAWQFQKALYIAEKHGFTKFVSMQNHYNLIYREEEREMLPLCNHYNIAVTPYSPYAGGRLVRTTSTEREDKDGIAKIKYDGSKEKDQVIIDRVGELSDKHNTTRARIAMSWLLQQPSITSPIIGPTKIQQLDCAVAALDFKLSEEELEYLKEQYVPHNVVGAL